MTFKTSIVKTHITGNSNLSDSVHHLWEKLSYCRHIQLISLIYAMAEMEEMSGRKAKSEKLYFLLLFGLSVREKLRGGKKSDEKILLFFVNKIFLCLRCEIRKWKKEKENMFVKLEDAKNLTNGLSGKKM